MEVLGLENEVTGAPIGENQTVDQEMVDLKITTQEEVAKHYNFILLR